MSDVNDFGLIQSNEKFFVEQFTQLEYIIFLLRLETKNIETFLFLSKRKKNPKRELIKRIFLLIFIN